MDRPENRSADPGATHGVAYMDRTRRYYEALGYDTAYRWAAFHEVPFAPPRKPLAQSVVALITTAGEMEPPGWRPGEPRPPKRVFSFSSDFPPQRLYTQDLSWHKEATHTDDLNSYFPIHSLQELVGAGKIGALAPRCHGVPTEYSQRRTREQDAPQVLARCRADGADCALLCPL